MEKKYTPPFNTRCSLQAMKDLSDFINEDVNLKKRVEKLGFRKLLNLRCTKFPRDIIYELTGAYDGPSKQLLIRGKKVKITPEDVATLMGVNNKGLKVALDASEEVVRDISKKKVRSLPYGTIFERIKNKDNDFEFYFVLYILGVFLCPTGCGRVSEKLLKVMAGTYKKWDQYDWATYVLDDVSSYVQEFCNERKKGRNQKLKH